MRLLDVKARVGLTEVKTLPGFDVKT